MNAIGRAARFAAVVACGSALLGATAPVPATPEAAPAPYGPPAWVAFAHVWSDVASYSATVTAFERKDAKVQTFISDYTFRKPASEVVHLITGPHAGVTLEWSGGETVVAHHSGGLLAMFKKTYPLHDPQISTIRGASVDEMCFGSILAHAHDVPGTFEEEAGVPVDGVPTQAVTLVPKSPATDGGLTREVVYLSTVTKMPVRILAYEGTTLVRQVDFSKMTVEPARTAEVPSGDQRLAESGRGPGSSASAR